MVINTNLSAQWSATRLQNSSGALAQSLQRLSSGSKITSPADDSAGLAVSMKLGGQLARIDAASSNIANAISFKQTQDGYLAKVSDALTRMGEIAFMAMDVTKTDQDRALYNQEYTALGQSVFALGRATFNGVSLFDGATLHTTNDAEGNTIALSGLDLNHDTAGLTYFYAFNNTTDSWSAAGQSVFDVRRAMTQLAADRAKIGAELESLSYYSDQLGALKTNLSAANSRITDVDVAEESTRYAKWNILVQSGTAMLAQANSQPQAVLKLLGG